LVCAGGQPRHPVGGGALLPPPGAKAGGVGFSLIGNHPFVDGNKRVGHAALETFLVLNGVELAATVDVAEAEIVAVAAGARTREAFAAWVEAHLRPLAR
jgi:death-on-curing protein